MFVCCGLPFDRGEGRWVVSVLMLPPLSTRSPAMSASCHAPWETATVPGTTRGVTLANSSISPNSFFTRTVSPCSMPRGSASTGLIQASCGLTSLSSGMKPHELWMRPR